MEHYESEFCLSDGWGSNRREGASGTYHPYIPDRLADADIRLTAETASATAEAERDVSTLNEKSPRLRKTEPPLARLVLRSEAIASSRIKALRLAQENYWRMKPLKAWVHRSVGITQRLQCSLIFPQ